MTWQELADFINTKMPEEERNKDASIYYYGTETPIGGLLIDIVGISPFNVDENCEYFIDINTKKPWN